MRSHKQNSHSRKPALLARRQLCLCALTLVFSSLPSIAQQVSCAAMGSASGQLMNPAHAEKEEKKEPDPVAQLCDFHLYADKQTIIQQVLKAYGIDPVLDASVVDASVVAASIGHHQIHFDSQGLSFDDAMQLVKLATATFFVNLAPRQFLVLADTKENRTRYMRLFEKQINIPGPAADEFKEMQGIAGNIFGLTHGISQDSRGRIIVRAPEESLNTMNDAYHELFAGQSQLSIQVDLYEVDYTRENKAGVTAPNTITAFNVDSEINSLISSNSTLVQEIIDSGLASAGDYTAILAALIASGQISGSVFNNPFVLFGGGRTETGVEWNTSTADMLLNTSDVRSINQTQLRVLNHEQATFRSGERYPIQTAIYSSLGSSSGISVPQVEYQNLGLTLKITPSVENQDSVALSFDLQIASLAGSSINDVPVLTNRQYSSNVGVHFGSSALITSAISKQDVSAIRGLTGLGATDRDKTITDVELVIKVTPTLTHFPHPAETSDLWSVPPS